MPTYIQGLQKPIGFLYAKEDENLIKDFIRHLTMLKRHGLIRLVGAPEQPRVQVHDLEYIHYLMLFLSPAFLGDETLIDLTFMARDEGVPVIPIVLRPCRWQQISCINGMVYLPRNDRAVTQQKKDSAFLLIAEDLRKKVER